MYDIDKPNQNTSFVFILSKIQSKEENIKMKVFWYGNVEIEKIKLSLI